MSDCLERAGAPAQARTTKGFDTIFAFEQDFEGSLRCIPMIVRFKLDLAGVKLSLRQWSQFDHATRTALVRDPCDAAEEVADYRDALIGHIERQTDEPAKLFSPDQAPAWAETTRTAQAVTAWAEGLGVAPPTDDQWRGLSDLQRFTLIKLTRAGHDNDNFYPALVEFGLGKPGG